MKEEIDAAEKMEQFQARLTALLSRKYDGHWYPADPPRGQAYRCLRINQTDRREPLLVRASEESGLCYSDIKLPLELTVWIDPGEVICRFGENRGSYCNVATFKDGKMENFIDHINIEELEKTMEAVSEASYSSRRFKADAEPSFKGPEIHPPRKTYAEICTCGKKQMSSQTFRSTSWHAKHALRCYLVQLISLNDKGRLILLHPAMMVERRDLPLYVINVRTAVSFLAMHREVSAPFSSSLCHLEVPEVEEITFQKFRNSIRSSKWHV
ncbi:BTG4 [Cordylochernes scorpioides]|uniref:BTG4 n=1 Tax=Cordylochernes scorpioides TaxID=51811 RepID=A0ABY6LHD6_9ARAC|nr:BTG4 [Cordylochernes scorpioides]